jgi:leucyl aminopeptidase
MEFHVKSGQPEKQRSACLIIGVYANKRLSTTAKKIDQLSEQYISNVIRRGDLEGKLGQTLLLHHVPGLLAERVLLIGCGPEADLADKQFKKLITSAAQALSKISVIEATSYLTEIKVNHRDIAWMVRQSVQIINEHCYRFEQFKSQPQIRRGLRRFNMMLGTRKELTLAEKAIQQGLAIVQGMVFTKNLANTPPNICTPSYLAEQASELSQRYKKMSVSILEAQDMENLGMGLLLSVSQGSPQPPKLISLEYRGAPKAQKPVVLIGKGVTFDTGGNSLKSPSNMLGMKYDMCGGATVMGVLEAVAKLALPLNVVGIIPACENTPGGHASRPDDIVTSMSGLSVEIQNTDAEGRLILADALTYCERFNPATVIDIATLTGACVVALGHHTSALLSNEPALAQELLDAGLKASDPAWQLPLWDEYQEQIESKFADIRNVGGPAAGTITAACFLSRFAEKYQWAHLDVAGTACIFAGEKQGASGRPVPLLVQYLIDKA